MEGKSAFDGKIKVFFSLAALSPNKYSPTAIDRNGKFLDFHFSSLMNTR